MTDKSLFGSLVDQLVLPTAPKPRRNFLPPGSTAVYRQALPEFLRQAYVRKYHREYWHAHPEYKVRDLARKNEKYANDPEYREKKKATERERRRNWTPEQHAADYQRRKLKSLELTDAEYNRRRQKQNERSRKWRAKKKAESAAC